MRKSESDRAAAAELCIVTIYPIEGQSHEGLPEELAALRVLVVVAVPEER
jgi:hypothetical protein